MKNEKIISLVSKKIDNEMERILFDSLKKKGFEFKDNIELEKFIKERCWCENNIDSQERTYYIDNNPFLLWEYPGEIKTNITVEKGNVKVSANLGPFTFL